MNTFEIKQTLFALYVINWVLKDLKKNHLRCFQHFVWFNTFSNQFFLDLGIESTPRELNLAKRDDVATIPNPNLMSWCIVLIDEFFFIQASAQEYISSSSLFVSYYFTRSRAVKESFLLSIKQCIDKSEKCNWLGFYLVQGHRFKPTLKLFVCFSREVVDLHFISIHLY